MQPDSTLLVVLLLLLAGELAMQRSTTATW